MNVDEGPPIEAQRTTMETKVIVTIDTEVRIPERPDAFEHDVLGTSAANSRGAYWIADKLRSYGFPGVFFLDVYGRDRYGEAGYQELCHYLLDKGHAIDLHTHPHQMYDIERFYMHQYTLDEQRRIVRDGLAMLRDWTGSTGISHRAGGYGANLDTLTAIRENGIRLDSSHYYARPDKCKLPFGPSNAPFEANGVWQIPITIAREPIVKRGYRFPFWSRHLWYHHQKLDVNTMRPKQLCLAIEEQLGKIPYIITFLHSFSFIQRYEDVVHEKALTGFQSMLELLAEKRIPVITFDQVATELGVRNGSPAEALPDVLDNTRQAVSG